MVIIVYSVCGVSPDCIIYQEMGGDVTITAPLKCFALCLQDNINIKINNVHGALLKVIMST